MKAQWQKGFTLIELMIVVAIIGILAAIAVPMMRNYITKTQISRALVETRMLRVMADECLSDGICTPHADTEITSPSPIIRIVTIKVYGSGAMAVRAVFNASAGADLKEKVVTWSRTAPASGAAWSCNVNIEKALAPASCPGTV